MNRSSYINKEENNKNSIIKRFKYRLNDMRKGSRITLCLLSGLFLTTVITIPTVSCSSKEVTKSVTIQGTGKDIIKPFSLIKQDDGSYKGKIEIAEGKLKEDIYSILILVNEQKLIINIEYTLNTNTGELIINKGVIKGDEKITIEIKKKEVVSESNIDWNTTKFNSSTYGFNKESIYDKAKVSKTITFKKGDSLSGVLVGEDSNKDKIYASYDVNTKALNIWSTGKIVFTDNDLVDIDKDKRGIFYNCVDVSSISLDNIDTSKMTIMSGMFANCINLKLLNLLTFDTSNVIDMSYMFSNLYAINSINLSSFNTSNVTNMSYMFQNCESLKSIDVKSFNTSKVTNMGSMFENCQSLTSLDLSKFDTSEVTNMGIMFENNKSLKTLNLSDFNTSKVNNMANMFLYCESIESINVSSFDTSNVTNMINMFGQCIKLTSLDLSKFNTSKVSNMSSMFVNCKELTSLDLSSFDTPKVTDMSSMFFYCEKLKNINISSFNTSNVLTMMELFSNCKALINIDISSFSFDKIVNTQNMFDTCFSLSKIYVKEGTDIAKVSELNSHRMFNNCVNLVGENGTTYDTKFIDSKYAHIDGGEANPGYFSTKKSLN